MTEKLNLKVKTGEQNGKKHYLQYDHIEYTVGICNNQYLTGHREYLSCEMTDLESSQPIK